MTDVYADGNYSVDLHVGDIVSISSKEELEMLQKYIETGRLTEGVTFSQTQDIVASEYRFYFDETTQSTQIYKDDILVGSVTRLSKMLEVSSIDVGSMYTAGEIRAGFCGTYDGNGYQIKGLWCVAQTSNIGLFSKIGNGGCVKDINMVNCYMQGADNCGIVASQNAGVIQDCNASQCIVVGKGYIGGVAGINAGNINKVKAYENYVLWLPEKEGAAGGIAGKMVVETSESTCVECTHINSKVYCDSLNVLYFGYSGGIVGKTEGNTLVYKCLNSSNVCGENAGGITGGASYGVKIIDCMNHATIGKKDSEEDYRKYAGGAVGIAANVHGRDVLILNCQNDGDVYAGAFAGGVVGRNIDNTIMNCYNYGNITVHNPYAENIKEKAAGGLIGVFQRRVVGNIGLIVNSANYGDVTGDGVICASLIGSMPPESEELQVTPEMEDTTRIYNCFTLGNVTGNP